MLLLVSIALSVKASALTVVSDVDDTMKATDVLHRTHMVKNGLFSNRAFIGMKETYQALANTHANFIYLSGSGHYLEERVEGFLKQNHFPEGKLILKDNTDFSKVYDYKLKNLKPIFETSSDDFILIGDDTESDFLVYRDIQKLYPLRVKGIYIHQITAVANTEAAPTPEMPFLTGFDLSLALFNNVKLVSYQPILLQGVIKSGVTILTETKTKNILPPFQSCPKFDYTPVKVPDGLAEIARQVQGKIHSICSSRAKAQ